MLLEYFEQLPKLKDCIMSEKILCEWVSFRQVYDRKTAEDFVNLTEELMVFLGEGFVTGSLS